MTEQEYINVRELSMVKSAIAALREITPQNSIIIPVSGLQTLMEQLYTWEQRLHATIEITNQ